MEMEFGELLRGEEAEGKEKHVPHIEVGKGRGREDVDVVRIVVGKEVPHPNTVEHHIKWIELYGVKRDGQVVDIGRVELAPTYTNPNVRFQVPVKEFKAFCALAYCNLHGLWKNCIEI
ncbi:MAG: class II SORL domain-containing protein [Canidatus Methanoxibalbensis ujae]|nr:class II SORL domain-containing protein [Candidatus Methanoxibalbensis ujae]MCW7078319.1 class II SORL domain-containing protein [Candidatus Methanoxibalbensis ujae]